MYSRAQSAPSLRHGRIPYLSYQRAISIYFPLCLSRIQQCCRFRKCSVAIAKCFSAFTRACSGNWAEHPLPSIRGDASSSLSSCRLIALIYRATSSHYLFFFLSHTIRRVVSRFPIYATRCFRIFFPLFLRTTKERER